MFGSSARTRTCVASVNGADLGCLSGMVASGLSESQIVDEYVARYGERILREPRGIRFQILNLVPILVGVVGCLCVVRFLSCIPRKPANDAKMVTPSDKTQENFEWL